ncbi:MAG: hypothetical protein M0Q91_16730 [Methanoregula sp.]|jgi:hypothetical protein|nr:hypothetical protein [Methanoregula sp.]
MWKPGGCRISTDKVAWEKDRVDMRSEEDARWFMFDEIDVLVKYNVVRRLLPD